MEIDITYCFADDSPGYWQNFFKSDGKISGSVDIDPDRDSQMLRRYHQTLWSRKLPNGETVQLLLGSKRDYLLWNDFRFGSDSIITSFRYKNNQKIISEAASVIDNYPAFMEGYIRESYTIGGMIIFPKRRNGINPTRGCNHLIKDRWDLTLECIRRYYLGENSPLYDTLIKDKNFFDLFVDFKGYVDYFFLQDCVNEAYTSVHQWLGEEFFAESPLPKTVDEYLQILNRQLDFLHKRNARIRRFVQGKNDYCCQVNSIVLE